MKSIISILPEQLANKIAAGEVIQRPANAVKELLENSIDAKARNLSVRVEGGGSTLIHCVDDGSGMTEEDALLSFRRHATSKIHTYEDLENIRTLGFRGEALASIGAVAQVELKTRVAGSELGTLVRVEGGTIKNAEPCATAPGTSIQIRNLFYNTPARRNFLKTPATEYRNVADVVLRVALSHPWMGVAFSSEKETIYNLHPSTQDERVKELFGSKLYDTLFAIHHETDLLRIDGYIGKPLFARKSRSEQYLFLNGRPIVNRSINHAVLQAYEHLLEKGSFPIFILFLTIDPKKVDVNVHPTKLEVKFEEESAIYRAILFSLRRSLTEQNLVPSFAIREEVSGGWSPGAGAGLRFADQNSQNPLADFRSLIRPAEAPGVPHVSEQMVKPGPLLPQENELQVWQLHKKYLIAAIDGGLMVVDQHAAHERVIYERTVGRFKEGRPQSQQLLFPQTIELSPSDAALVAQMKGELEAIGFTLKLFGKSTVIVDGIPIDVRPGEEARILQNVIDLFKRDEQEFTLEPRERLAKSFSCRAAIKKGDPLSLPEMKSLLSSLLKTEIPYVCPHGRPVIINLSIGELDRRFGRTS